jgi:hypothetical protein
MESLEKASGKVTCSISAASRSMAKTVQRERLVMETP